MAGDKDSFVVGYVSSPHPHAPFHVRTLELLDSVKAVHFCGLEGEDTAAIAAGTSKAASTTDDLDSLLARDDVDALIVCVRNDIGPGVLEAGIKAGKGALFEKPGSLRAADLRCVAELAKQRGLTMGTMFQNRFKPSVAEARESRQKGALGTVMAAEARMVTSQVRYRDPNHWLFGKATGGSGILGWLGCHYIDILCYMLDDRIVEVAAMLGNQNPERLEVEDTAMLTLRFAGGTLGTLHAGYHLPGSEGGYSGASYDSFLALRGTEGYVRLPMEDSGYTLFSQAPGWANGGMQYRSFDPPKSDAYGGIAGLQFVKDFLTASRTGAPAPVPIDAGIHVLEVIEAAIESSETGRAVKIG
jgi:predicted dehydrogenase